MGEQSSILSKFYRQSPYEGFPLENYSLDLTGWHSDSPVFEALITEARPKLYVEVGTWLGASAINAARILREMGLDTPVICIDTWLGAQEFWSDVEKERYQGLRIENGYPRVFHQFVANVLHSGLAETIIPLPQTSLIGARLLAAHKLQPDMIYIDASHDGGDVFMDLDAYWRILAAGGVMFGDDFDEYWPGLVEDVNRFAVGHGVEIERRECFWIMRKPAEGQVVRMPETKPGQLDPYAERVVALETENAIMRGRIFSRDAQFEIAIGEKDKLIREIAKDLELMRNTCGYYSNLSLELKDEIRKLKDANADLEARNRALVNERDDLKGELRLAQKQAGGSSPSSNA